MAEAEIHMFHGIANLAQGKEGVNQAIIFASQHGYPVMLKATSGGGGRGLRRIDNYDDLIGTDSNGKSSSSCRI